MTQCYNYNIELLEKIKNVDEIQDITKYYIDNEKNRILLYNRVSLYYKIMSYNNEEYQDAFNEESYEFELCQYLYVSHGKSNKLAY